MKQKRTCIFRQYNLQLSNSTFQMDFILNLTDKDIQVFYKNFDGNHAEMILLGRVHLLGLDLGGGGGEVQGSLFLMMKMIRKLVETK